MAKALDSVMRMERDLPPGTMDPRVGTVKLLLEKADKLSRAGDRRQVRGAQFQLALFRGIPEGGEFLSYGG